jgi:hypothetical protein
VRDNWSIHDGVKNIRDHEVTSTPRLGCAEKPRVASRPLRDICEPWTQTSASGAIGRLRSARLNSEAGPMGTRRAAQSDDRTTQKAEIRSDQVLHDLVGPTLLNQDRQRSITSTVMLDPTAGRWAGNEPPTSGRAAPMTGCCGTMIGRTLGRHPSR